MAEQTSLLDQLHALSQNFWWCWQPDVWQLFAELDSDLWEDVNHNPLAFLGRADRAALEARARKNALGPRIAQATRRLDEYVSRDDARVNMEAGPLHAAPVAYFCAEFGLHESLRIYSGGLGVLAGDHMKASSDAGIPIVGVGLFYALGYFRQTIDEQGWQKEYYDHADTDTLPITKLTDEDGAPIEIVVESGTGPIHAHVWRLPVGRNQILLLDADVDANTEEDRALTSLLYGGDKRTRVRQELLLGVGGVRVLRRLGIRPSVYHLNEGHSAFAPLEAAYHLMNERGLDFETARLEVARRTVFTTHTPVPAGHDRFPLDLFEEHMSPLRERLGLDHYQFHGLGRVNPDDVGETFCMTVLAIKTSHYRNGVSNLHGRVSRSMWSGLYPYNEVRDVPIGHITNGVHVPSFLAPEMRALFERHLEVDWMSRMEQRETWAPLSELDPGELWQTHQVLKSKLIAFIQARAATQVAPKGDKPGQIVPGSGFDPEVLTLGFARRFATYKRADLIFSDLERVKKLITDADRPIQLVFAGKAHPADEPGKRLLKSIVDMTTNPEFKGRVFFLADYDMNIGRHLVQGVDVWLNNPRRPQEACGTSGEKAVLNGVLNCSILDGWYAEGYDGTNGFAIGGGEEFTDIAKQDAHDAAALYSVLEDEIIPLYYDVDADGLRRNWVDRMTWGILSLAWRYNAQRMVIDYLRTSYLPAAGATVI